MSVNILSDEHLTAIALMYVTTPDLTDPAVLDYVKAAGHELQCTNVAAYRHRYSKPDASAPFPFMPVKTIGCPSLVEGLKLLECYDVQTCEAPGYLTSRAAEIIRLTRSKLISRLPGFSTAKWEL